MRRDFTPASLKTGSLFAASALFSVVVALTLPGCPTGGALDDPERFGPGETGCDAPAYLAQACAGNICHDPGGSGNVDLVSPGVEQRLIGVPASYENVDVSPENCPVNNPELLVDPNDIDNSLLLTKLRNEQTCGTGMPVPFITRIPEYDCIRAWVQQIVSQANTAEAP